MLHSVRSTRGMVTSPHYLASQAGLEILKEGGSAADAAVAVAATLAVVYPHMTGIGGDSFWLLSRKGAPPTAIMGCGRSALAANRELYAGMDAIPTRGPLAANTVAGAISGWEKLLAANGRMPFGTLLRSAIHYAEAGVPVTRSGAQTVIDKGAELRGQPGSWAKIFDGTAEGAILKQPALARTLTALAEDGPGSFYHGPLAKRIAADLASVGSPVTLADLEMHLPILSRALTVEIPGAKLYNSQPPTQGIASLLILALYERVAAAQGEGFDHVHRLVEATKQAFLWRDRYLCDPLHMKASPQALLDDAGALDAMAARIDPARALSWPQPASAGDTTWFAAADSAGTVVSAIQSIYHEFGSGVVLPETGIVWQNRGSSFRLADTGPNLLAPDRMPFHTLNPALACFADGRVMAYGTMGGEGQPQTQAAIFTRYARYGMPLQEAITLPRWLLGRTWGAESVTLKLEDRFPPELIEALRAAGHDVEIVEPFAQAMGHAGAIVRHPEGTLEGATDPRSDGQVAAW